MRKVDASLSLQQKGIRRGTEKLQQRKGGNLPFFKYYESLFALFPFLTFFFLYLLTAEKEETFASHLSKFSSCQVKLEAYYNVTCGRV